MIIWIFNHYADKPGGSATRHFDLSKRLVEKGHEVHIFSSAYSHNRFKYEVDFRLFSFHKKEIHEGVIFHLFKTFPYTKNDWRRSLNMLSYFILVLGYSFLIKSRPNVIIGSSVHPFAALAAYLLAFLRRSYFIFEVRDLWPQTLIDIGKLSEKSLLTYFLRKLEKFLYKKSLRIITLMPFADEYIGSLGIDTSKVVWIPNGTDLERYKQVKHPTLKETPPFALYYLGALGDANGLDIIIRAFRILEDKHPGMFQFYIYGSGPEKENLIRLTNELNLHNIFFCEIVPKDHLHEVISKADAFVFILKDLPLFRYGISPNKLNDYLSSKRPVVAVLNSRNNPVLESFAGISTNIVTPEGAADAISTLFLKTSPHERILMGQRGYDFVAKNFDINILAEHLENVIKDLNLSSYKLSK